jgi:3-dehydroquinate synthase
LLHGEAVGWGMIAAAMIGASMQITDPRTAQRIYQLVLAYGPLPKLPVDPRSVMKRLLSDKKTVDGVPHFVLPAALGKVEVANNVPARTAIQAIKAIRYLSKA